MTLALDEGTWQVITYCYKKNSCNLSPTTRILVENLLASLQANRVITSTNEADLIITLLLTAALSSSGAIEDERSEPALSPTKDNWYDENSNLVIRINHVVDQLRIFAKNMETYANKHSKEQMR